MSNRPLAVVFDPLSRVTDFDYELEARLLAERGVELVVPDNDDERDQCLLEASVVISSGLERVSAGDIERMPKCVGIVAAQVGLDHIDVDAAEEAGISVVNVTASTEEVADHAMALVLASLRRIVAFDEVARRGDWDPLNIEEREGLRRIRGQVMGIVGPGRIGIAVATRARAFGFDLVAAGRRSRSGEAHPGTSKTDPSAPIEYVDFDELLARSDVIVVCADANSSSVGLLGVDAFARMKDGVVVVNVTRGVIIDEAALADAIDDGKVAIAALDVRNPEPPDPGTDRLTGHPAVIQTPHVGGASQESRQDLHVSTAGRVLESLAAAGMIEHSEVGAGDTLDLATIHHVDQLESMARELLAPTTYGYVAGGAGLEKSVRFNREALDRLELVPRVLRDVADVSTGTTVLGVEISHPLVVGPSAVQRISHVDGEIATARAVKDAGLSMILSMNSSTTMEEVGGTGVEFWMQLYFSRDREHMRAVIQRASDAGARALCLTVDHAGMPTRLRELAAPLVMPSEVSFVHLDPDPTKRGIDRSVTWEVIEWIKDVSDLPVVLKGILHPDDGRLAAESGVAAVIVSNHGGRQLDGAVSAYEVLAPLLEAVAGRVEVYADGGIRSGTDLFKVIAIGARAGLIGRPVWWGLAAGGQKGVARVLELITGEFEETMRLCGASSLSEVDGGLIYGG